MHHPKKWGATQCGWKAHDIDSLQHLIEEAWKNNLETKIKQVAITTTPGAKHSTPNSHRSNDSVSKPRFVTNCDWVNQELKDEKKESLDMGEYFNKERQERANSRKKQAAVSKSPVPSPKPPLPPKDNSILKSEEDEHLEHEEVCDLPKGNSVSNFSKNYSK